MASNHLILCRPLLLLPSILHQTKSVIFKHGGWARRFATKVPPPFIPRLAQRPAGTVRRLVQLRVTCHRAPGLSRRRRGQSGQPSQQGDWYRGVRGQKSELAAFSTEPTGGGVSRSWVWNYEAEAPMARPLRAREGDKEMPRASGGRRPRLSLPKSCSPEPQPHSGRVLPRGEAPPVPQPHSGLALPQGKALPEQQQAWQSHLKQPTALCPAEGRRGAGVTPAFSRPLGPPKGRHPTGDPRILPSYVLSLKSVEQNKIVTNNSCGAGNRRQ